MVSAKKKLTQLDQGHEVSKNRQWLIIKAFAFVLLISIIISWLVCWFIVHPQPHPINETPAMKGLVYRDITFTSRKDNLELRGWLIPSDSSDRIVIMAHGYRNNRVQDDVPALSLAKELVNAGYNVFMFDFRNCGESDGNMTSIGQYEMLDLLGAIDYVSQYPDISRQIALLGFSMGASAAILVGFQEPVVDAIIADSPFADLKQHLSDKSYPFNILLMPELSFVTGLSPELVSPINAVATLTPKPLFIIHGDADKRIPKENSEQIFKAAGANASLWIVPGACHLKAYATEKNTYSSKVIEFLNNNLK